MEGNTVNKDLNFNFSQKRKKKGTMWTRVEKIFFIANLNSTTVPQYSSLRQAEGVLERAADVPRFPKPLLRKIIQPRTWLRYACFGSLVISIWKSAYKSGASVVSMYSRFPRFVTCFSLWVWLPT